MKKIVFSLILMFFFLIYFQSASACGCIDESEFDVILHVKTINNVNSNEHKGEKDEASLKLLVRSYDDTITKEIEVSETKHGLHTFIFNHLEYPKFQLEYYEKGSLIHQTDFIAIPMEKEVWYRFDVETNELKELKFAVANGNKMILVSIFVSFLVGFLTKMFLALKMRFQNIQIPISVNILGFSVLSIIFLFNSRLTVFLLFTIVFTIIEIFIYKKWLKTNHANGFLFYPILGLVIYYLVLFISFLLFGFLDSQF